MKEEAVCKATVRQRSLPPKSLGTIETDRGLHGHFPTIIHSVRFMYGDDCPGTYSIGSGYSPHHEGGNKC